jgi:hypothetical protein
MNPTFPATPYTGLGITNIDDPVSRQHLNYDNWLFNERTRNWAAYMSHMQQKQQELRVRVLQMQYQNSMAKFYEEQLREQEQRKALEAQQLQEQQEERRQKQQDQADMESYLKEIEEQRQQQDREAAQEKAAEEEAQEWYQSGEDFAKSCRAEARREAKDERRERRRLARQDKRRFAAASKLAGKYLDDCLDNTNNPIEGEVSRAENYNADKPSRNVRYIGADKRKGQLFQARRQFGSGWGKQQL